MVSFMTFVVVIVLFAAAGVVVRLAELDMRRRQAQELLDRRNTPHKR